MKFFKWLIMPLALLAPASAFPMARSEAVITLTSLEIDRAASDGSQQISGKFLLRNGSRRHICVLRDISENELSPFLEVVATGKNRMGANSAGVPYPPKTRDIMTLAPGASVRLHRVLGYVESPGGEMPSFVKVRTMAAWCDNDKRFKIESRRFKLPVSENWSRASGSADE